MNVINRTHLNGWMFHKHYNFDYLERNLNAGRTTKIRAGDAWPAICMAFDAFTENDPLTEYWDQITFKNQIEYLQANKKRTPKTILEVGSGCGEVSCGFYHMNCTVHSVDCNVSSYLFHQGMFGLYGFYESADHADRYNLYLGQMGSFLDCIPQDLDTLVLVESIEHMDPEEWEKFFAVVSPILRHNHGRLIITNTIWPLGGKNDPAPDHVMRVDDDFYDRLVEQGGTVLYRKRANLCIQY